MGSLPIGAIMMGITVFYAVELDSWHLFLNTHAIVVVIFGTMAILALSTPTRVLKSTWSAVKGLMHNDPTITEHWKEIEELAKKKTLAKPSVNPLINHASQLWETGVSSDLFIAMIAQHRSDLETRHSDAVAALRNLAKYPPALGMIGTVVGLVSLFSNLGSNNKDALGPSLALAMTATFFGLILANALITPLADRLHVYHIVHKRFYMDIYQALMLINRGESLELMHDQAKE